MDEEHPNGDHWHSTWSSQYVYVTGDERMIIIRNGTVCSSIYKLWTCEVIDVLLNGIAGQSSNHGTRSALRIQ